MKNALRTHLRDQLSRIDTYHRTLLSVRIAAHAAGIKEIIQARRIALYWSKPDEVDTTPLITTLRRAGATVYIPRITTNDMLEFCPLDPNRVTIDQYDITVPDHTCRPINPNKLDLIIVPCLGCDQSGTRLGRGKGYYDRFLASLDPRIPRVALMFSAQVVSTIPRQEHDQPIDAAITEDGIMHYTTPHLL